MSKFRVVMGFHLSDLVTIPRTGRGQWLAGSRIPRGVPGSLHHLPRVPTRRTIGEPIFENSGTCRSFWIYFAGGWNIPLVRAVAKDRCPQAWI